MRGQQKMRFQLTAVGLACATLLAGCGGGGGGKGSDAGMAQSVSFPFPGGSKVAVPPAVATITLKATASSGGPITYVSNTPATCSVSGDTLSLLKSGECSVNANQAGGDGYAAATARQLFVVPKNDQGIWRFANPGTQPVGASVQVTPASTAGSLTDFPISITTSSPTVCSVTGTTLKMLADGLCIVTATQAGSDFFNEATLTKTIPVGAAEGPALTFTGGYRPTDSWRTAEAGKIEGYSSSGAQNTVADDGSTFTFRMDKRSSAAGFGGYYGLRFYAATLENLVAGANTLAGVRIDSQKAIKFNMLMNPEMITAQKTELRVWLYLGHYANNCNVVLEKFMTPVFSPSVQGLQEQSVDLKSFTVQSSCGLSNLDVWDELQNYPIAKLEFNVPGINDQVPTAGTDIYTTSVTMGKITFK
ncbi:hypothetical protein [Duganella hordei]|uniref:hypothetical protein n=1 Tax=Duganella hordei TaxID=2865934 RepID=UPI00159DAF90